MGMRPNWAGYIFAEDVDETTRSIAKRRRKGLSAAGRYPGRRPLLGGDRSARGDVHAAFAAGRGAAPVAADDGRPCRLAGTLHHRLEERLRLLRRHVRLAEGRSDGHGADGRLPALHGRRRADRRHDEQAGRDTPRDVALLLQCRRHRRCRRDASRDGGGQVLNGPMEVPGGGWIVQCMDPQGAMFALVGRRD